MCVWQSTDSTTRHRVAPRPPAAPRRPASRPSLVRALVLNAMVFGVLWVGYSAVRTVTADSWSSARSNADRVIAFQDSLGLPSEAVFQSLFLDHEWLVRAANIYYIGFHFPSMVLFLAWALLLKRDALPRIRWALIGATATGLVIHLAFPLAPPRMLSFGGFVDTARIIGPDPYALGVAKTANELAAMPSLHVGWALLIALAVVGSASSRFRWIVLAHPIITTLVVVVTANHYWVDVVVGAAIASMAWWLACVFRPGPDAPAAFELIDLAAEFDDERVGAATRNGTLDSHSVDLTARDRDRVDADSLA